MDTVRIKNELLEDIVTDKMGEYSTYVLLSRAIPDIRDGLKPSYRRILWAMRQMKATRLTKSANVSGEVMSYHPHGDTYPTMVGMTQTDAQHSPYIIGKGNFGNYASELAYGASRYTEVKLSDISVDMMSEVDKDGVEMIDNYDGTKKIPEVFPVKYPSILAYAQSGIGVGFSSSIPSFNTTELCNATIKYIEEGKKTMLVPDFGTRGSVVRDAEVIKSINNHGRGSTYIRAKAEINGNEIIISEIPYSTTKEKIVNRIIALSKSGKLNEVRNVEDLSGRKGISVIVTAKRGVDMDVFLEKLYQSTPMQSTYSANMMVINSEGLPELLGVWDIIDEWLVWRRGVITRMLKHDKQLKETQLQVLKGLDIIKDDIDEVVAVIRKSTDKNIIDNLVKEFGLTEFQAKRISGLRLRNLTTTFIKKQLIALEDTAGAIGELDKAINNSEIKDGMIIGDLRGIIKRFGKERQSEIISKKKILKKKASIPVEPEYEEYNVKVFITEEHYLKKIPLTSLRSNSEIVTKQSDKIIHEVETTNSEEVLIFTDKGNAYKKRLYELSDSKTSDLGTFLPSEIDLEPTESILHVAPLNSEHSHVIIGYSSGKVAKIDLDSYRTKTNRSVLRGAFADKTAILFKVISDDIDLMAISTDTKTVLLNTDIISSKASRTTKGNNFIRLRDGEQVEKYIAEPEIENAEYYRVKSASVGKYLKE